MNERRDPPAPPIGRWGSIWRYAIVVIGSLFSWLGLLGGVLDHSPVGHVRWFLIGDPLLGLFTMILVHWRRRWPLRIAAATTVLSCVSAASGGAAILALASVAARRRWRELAWLVPLSIGAGITAERFYPGAQIDVPLMLSVIMMILMAAVVVAVGYAVGGRRELVRERQESLARDQQRRVAQAAAAERTRIAREMHDVLAHRISLVAMHAGALNYRRDLSAEQTAQIAATIESNAQQALRDLREVLGVLRGPRPQDATGAPEPPQPAFSDIPALVREVQGAGMRVVWEDTSEGTVPAAVGRTAYRVVQEALTNARKHAPGARVDVRTGGRASDGLTLRVHNPRSLQAISSPLPTSGLGLLGLDERVSLAGGRLRHGVAADGGYELEAWLPWPRPETPE